LRETHPRDLRRRGDAGRLRLRASEAGGVEHMSNLPLTVACWDYDRTRAIMDGRVKVEGCDVNYLPLAVEETFFRAFKSAEFDVCELSFSTYLLSLSRERDLGVALPYRAVPAFVSRVFRHSG